MNVFKIIKSKQVGCIEMTRNNWFQDFICWIFRIKPETLRGYTFEIEVDKSGINAGDTVKSDDHRIFYVLSSTEKTVVIKNLTMQTTNHERLNGLLIRFSNSNKEK